MIKEYAQERLEAARQQAEKWGNLNVEINLLKAWLSDKNIQNILNEAGNDKTKNIIATMQAKKDNRYFKITEKMAHAIISDVTSKLSIEQIIEKLPESAF